MSLKSILMWALAFVLAGVGAASVFLGGRGIIRSSASKDWPSTAGRVVRTEIERSFSQRDNSKKLYEAKVIYEFKVDGTTHTGDRRSFGEPSRGTSNQAKQQAERYPLGKRITVYYVPGYLSAVSSRGLWSQ